MHTTTIININITHHATSTNSNKSPTDETMSDNKIALPSEGAHGDRNGTATATCYCGAVQIEVPTEGEGLVDSFICYCTDCRKITASMFASNFIVKDTHLTHTRGAEKLTRFKQSNTIATGNSMENSFCSVCGTLMYRRSSGYPGVSIPRIGTIDDYSLQETKFKPRIETFTKDRCAWLRPADVEVSEEGAYYTAGKAWKSSHDGAGGEGK
ncbi:glutathione-dependent formaldehyde-activating gfa [Pyrenophora seminiperda CCB06]|uniref:Glutathione-dependent formaldehyde-activating gfa n=1 Tax=Pyrenophora seminiperda CCB06 TaxID=1302712 RepID=A0A3M7MF52_9PLEO|nr:glutathione-dependent formaldehyde-activating gfa [Pyrenophora seminiperda CCB06]